MNELNGHDIEDLNAGMTATFAKTITEADIVLFAGASGDNNAVHINEEFAAGTRFKGRIEDTVDYRRLAALVKEVFAGRERLLLEGLAGAVVDGILDRFPAVERARVRVRKPDVVLDPAVEHAAVIIERTRSGRGQTPRV